MSDKSRELIDYPHVGAGMYLSLGNAKRLFEDAKFLYDNKRFQGSIPIFIICIEECFKSHELSIRLRKFQSVSQDDWENLMKHEHKLNYVNDFARENFESMTDEQFEEFAKKTQNEDLIKHRKEINRRNQSERAITSQLQFLKESCLYQNWNKGFGEWDDFDFLKPEQKEDLAFFVMKRASVQIKQLHFGIEHAVNILRRDGNKLTNLEYPKYNEFREVQNYDAKLNDYNKIIEDFPKYHRGEKIMLTLIAQKAFGIIDQVHTKEIIRKCLKLAQTKDFDNWYPHPIIKAIFLATSGITETSENGNYYGIADDSDQTYEGKPMMSSIAIVSKKEGVLTIEKITINEKEYSANDKIIEQILETETIIEKHAGKEIPLEKMHEAYSKIGMKLRKLKDSEIEEALSESKQIIEQNKFKASPEMISKMKEATKENWEELDPTVRSCIASCYHSKRKPEKNTIIMTGYIDPIRKFKVRGLLYRTLIMQNEFF